MIGTIKTLYARIEKFFSFETRKLLWDQIAHTQLMQYLDHPIPWTNSAMRPSAINLIINEIIIHNRRHILEIGCGISTIIISKVLAQLGGKVLSIENDQNWIDTTMNYMANEKNTTRIVHSELVEVEFERCKYLWYDFATIRPFLEGTKFDLLLVDAPLSGLCKMSRYPAMPVVFDYLQDDFVVFLDDIERRDESVIATRWSQKYNLTLTKSYLKGGLGVLRPQGTKCVYNIY